MSTQTRNVIIAIIAVIIVALAACYVFGDGATRQAGPSATSTASSTVTTSSTVPTATSTAGVSVVKRALLDTTGNGTGPSRGCDNVVMVDTQIATTTAPLNAALQALFASNTVGPFNQYNFIAKTKSTLGYSSVTLSNGVAKVYLTGSLSNLSGVCDDPRAKIQIEETALQFPTVQSVQIYLNNQLTNLTPSQQ